MSNFYRFYGDAPRTERGYNADGTRESADSWIARESQQKEFIGQHLSDREAETLRQIASNQDKAK